MDKRETSVPTQHSHQKRRSAMPLVTALAGVILSSTVASVAQPTQNAPAGPPAPSETWGPQPAPHMYGPEPEPSFQYRQQPSSSSEAAPHAVSSDPSQSAAIWNQLSNGKQLIRSGQSQQALEVIQQFIANKPLEPEGYFWQGVALDNLKRSDEALSAYGKAIEQMKKSGTDSAELRMNLGNVLLKQGRTDEAIAQYQRAKEIDPELGLVQLNLGRALTKKGDVEAALACFQRCEALHIQPTQLSYYKAKALWKAGKENEARSQVQELISKLPPNSPTTEKIKSEFGALLRNLSPCQF